jgi:hypothetical protein
LPGLAVSVDRPVADDPRVEEVQALLARPRNRPIRVSDEHRLTLVDSNLRWTNLNLERHYVLLNGSLSRSTVSFLASATKREKLCAGNPEKSNRSTEVFAFLAPNLVQAAERT